MCVDTNVSQEYGVSTFKVTKLCPGRYSDSRKEESLLLGRLQGVWPIRTQKGSIDLGLDQLEFETWKLIKPE